MKIMQQISEDYPEILKRERVAKEICSELNNFIDLKSTLLIIIKKIQQISDIGAVSIRLKDGHDYPFFVYNGFNDMYIVHESSLCARDSFGNILFKEDGKTSQLECMCGNVIRGNIDSSQPFFTENGSFFTNNTTKLLSESTEEARQGPTRNYCNAAGYESVALIPIKARGKRVGLIQLNDFRKGMFSEDLISFMEMIGEQVGLAVQNSLVYSKLKTALEEIKNLKEIIPICAHCKKIRDDEGYWAEVEEYFKKHSNSEFSHGICPECVEKHYSDYV
jgi:GAF domain-containing protein